MGVDPTVHFQPKQEFIASVLHSLLAVALIGSLFFYWFAVADRYHIFLYGHYGATPFDPRTVSRYWMAGFVAGGVALVVNVAGNWYAGRLAALFYHRYLPPAWWQIWLMAAGPLSLFIFWVTTRLNQPTLPAPIAVRCVTAALFGLALALLPGRLAARQPRKLLWIGLLGAGLASSLLLLRAVELPAQRLVSAPLAYGLSAGSLAFSIGWVASLHRLAQVYNQPVGRPEQWWLAGLCWSFLILPLFHHLVLTPPQYRYITVADNFFAANGFVQLLSLSLPWLAALAVATRWAVPPLTKGQSNELD